MNKLFLLLLVITTLIFVSCGDKEKDEPQKDVQDLEQVIPQEENNNVAKTDTTKTLPKADEVKQAEIKSADAPVIEKIDNTNNAMSGVVVSINEIALGNNGEVSSSEAGRVVSKGSILAFKSGNQIYLVYNEDGTFASKKLANYAGKKNLKIKGEIKKIDELHILIATSIE